MWESGGIVPPPEKLQGITIVFRFHSTCIYLLLSSTLFYFSNMMYRGVDPFEFWQ